MNDRVDLALAVDADGVHLGQQDVPIALARQLLGPQRLIGRSTTNPDEMQRAIAEGADYIGVGPVYETPTKVGKAAAGLDYVQYVAKMPRFLGSRSEELIPITSTMFWLLVLSECQLSVPSCRQSSLL
jgi:thiamine-phosphate diphosphorylase